MLSLLPILLFDAGSTCPSQLSTCSYWVRPGVEKEVRLSKCIGVEQAKRVAQELGRYKGFSGGRFYVNEFCTAFAPKMGPYGVEYVFLQKIDLNNWFPKPEIGQAETAASD